jgi:hypothetical protein
MGLRVKWLRIEPDRIPVVLEDINYGSEPAARFYALVATSTLIAAFGLIANSVAVIIGAMVVAPLEGGPFDAYPRYFYTADQP